MKSGVNGISWPGWETVRIIGRGSFGAVYEIAREVHGRTERAALKVISIPKDKSEIAELRADDYDDASITRYFADSLDKVENEYAVMVDMKGHPNVVYCEDIKKVQHDDGFGWDIYIKMELLTSLKDYLKSVRVDEKQIVRLGMDMCSALSLCREMNVVHRDIKPENIFVTRSNSFKLGDFGIARTMEKTSGGTKTGTYDYMAPEVNWHQEYHTEVDIYSLGLVLYWILNDSRLPFVENVRPTSSEKAAARERRFRGEALPTPQHGSKALKAIVLKACAFDPKERYADPAEMKRELEALLYGKTTELRPAPEPEPLPEVVDEPAPDITVGPEVPANDEDEITVGPVIPQMETDEPEEDVTIGPESPQVSEEGDEGGTVGPESLKPVNTNTVKKGSRGGWILAIISIAVFASALLGVFVIKHRETVLPTGTVLEVELEAYKEYLIEHTDASASSIAERINAKNAIQNCDTIEELQECIYVAALLREDKILDYIQWAGVSDKKDTSGHAEPLTIADTVIDGGTHHSVGLLSNGTVVTAGNNDDGCCEVSNWNDIVSISVGSSHTVGLRTDGTVVATGWNENGCCDVDGWTDIVAVSAGHAITLGLRADGTVVTAGAAIDSDFSQWSDIIAISTDGSFSIGLKSDGTVVATGPLEWNGFNIDGWKDLVAVESGDGFFGIKADGTVLATGPIVNYNTSEWHDIVAIAAENGHAVGLMSNGTVVATGNNEYGQCNVETWTDIVAIGVGWYHTLGVKSDGTVVTAGRNEYGACDVSDWTDIQIPARTVTSFYDSNENVIDGWYYNESGLLLAPDIVHDHRKNVYDHTGKLLVEYFYDHDNSCWGYYYYEYGNDSQPTRAWISLYMEEVGEYRYLFSKLYEYNDNGQLTAIAHTDPGGNITMREFYNSMGEVTDIKYYDVY